MNNQKINIVKSGVGNIGSIIRILKDINYDYIVVQKPKDFSQTKKIILPGVGSYDSFIRSLRLNNLFDEITNLVTKDNYSILGICVGMQALFFNSEEGDLKGFGFLNGKCRKFKSQNKKVPHIGWNRVNITKENKLFKGIKNNFFYFAHSYAIFELKQNYTISTTNYIEDFSSSIVQRNIYGVQFHPEKSYDQGKKIIQNFIEEC